MMNESFGRTSYRQGLAQGSQRQIAMQPVADGPADDAAGRQIDDHGQVQGSMKKLGVSCGYGHLG